MRMRAAKPAPQGKEGPRSVALREEGSVYESWESAYSAEAVIVFKIIKNITVPISSQFPPSSRYATLRGPSFPCGDGFVSRTLSVLLTDKLRTKTGVTPSW